MTALVLAFGLGIAALGAVGLASPPRMLQLLRRFQTPAGLYVAAAIRLALGFALVLAAPESRAPGFARGLGIFVIVAGIATPFFGIERYRRLLDWWSSRGEAFLRGWAAFALALGVALAVLVS